MTNAVYVRFFGKLASLTAAMLFVASVASGQESFKTPEAAVDALVGAAKSGDRKGVMTVLGAKAADIVSSGDPVADEDARKRVITAFDAKHQIAMDGDSKATMVIGPEDYPFPIPLVRKDGMWQFDTAAGRQEILFRRIGRNELNLSQKRRLRDIASVAGRSLTTATTIKFSRNRALPLQVGR